MKKHIVCLVVFIMVLAVSASAQTSSANERLLSEAADGNLSGVRSALNAGANINVKEARTGLTALLWASALGHLEVVEYLVEKGANLNLVGNDGHSALIFASAGGNLEMVKHLVERGANLNLVDKDGNSALDWARRNNKHSVYEYLSNAYNINLFSAAQSGNLSGARTALEKGANINYRSGDYNSTPLMEASYYGHLEVVKFLVEKGADITAADDDGDTVFFYAQWGEHYPVIDYLRSQATSMLYKAAQNGDAYGVELAVENGANINYRDEDDNTPIVVAAIAGKYNVVELLAELGANVNARNKEGRSALNYVHDRGDMDIYDFLVAHDARTFTPNPTPAPAPVIVVQAPAPAVVAQQPAPAAAPAPQVSNPAPQTNVYVQPSIDTNVYVQPSAPATPAPAQSSSSSSGQNSLQRAAEAVQNAINGSLDNGRYRRSGRAEEYSFTGLGNTGTLYYTDSDGKRSTGTWSISGDRITMRILGSTYFYTITSRTSFSGNGGEEWFRAGF